MTTADARRYLVRMTGLHVAALLLFLGMLSGVMGSPVPGVALIVVGMTGFVLAIVSATIEAVKRRSPGQPLVGAGSVYADMNRLTSWWYVPEASETLGLNAEGVRRSFSRLAILTVLAFVAVPVVAIATN